MARSYDSFEILIRRKFLSQYITVMNRANTLGFALLDRHQLFAQNAMIKDLIDLGAWAVMNQFYVFSTSGNGDFTRIDLKSPSQTAATKNGGLTYRSNIGWQGNASNAYLGTTTTNTFPSNNCAIWCKSRDNITGTQNRLYGGRAGASSNVLLLIPVNSGLTQATYRVGSTNSSVNNTDTSGYFMTVGTGTYSRLYRNSSLLGATTAPSPAENLGNIVNMLADYVSGAPSNYSAYTIETYLTGSSALEAMSSSLETIYNNYLNRL